MKSTHTIRNKAKFTPILSFTQAFLSMVLQAKPESVSLMLSHFKKEYKALTGKAIALDHEQRMLIHAHFGFSDDGVWYSKYSKMDPVLYHVERAFKDGMLQSSASMDEFLARSEAFYSMLDLALEAKLATSYSDANPM